MFKVLDNLLFKMNFKFFLRRLKILIHILSKVNPQRPIYRAGPGQSTRAAVCAHTRPAKRAVPGRVWTGLNSCRATGQTGGPHCLDIYRCVRLDEIEGVGLGCG